MAERYVVDASVVVQRFLRETYTSQARVLLARLFEGDRLYVPEFCLIECANVLWKQVRFRDVSQTWRGDDLI
jgi:predicted nucleic acid-binding protein